MSAAANLNLTTGARTQLDDLLSPWLLLLLAGVTVGAGIGPALPGVITGLDQWIDALDVVTSMASQLAAVASWLLLVHVCVTCVRVVRPRRGALLLIVLATWHAVVLMMAQRINLAVDLSLLTLAAGAAIALLAARHAPRAPLGLGWILRCVGLALAAETARLLLLREDSESELLHVLGLVRWALGLVALGLVVLGQWVRPGASRLALPLTLGVALLLAVTADQLGASGLPAWATVTGRAMQGLLPDGVTGTPSWGPALQLGLALGLAAWLALSHLLCGSGGSTQALLEAALALAIAVRASPVALAAVAVAATASVVLGHLPRPRPDQPAT